MSVQDKYLKLSDAQEITDVGATYSSNEINLGALKDAWGDALTPGDPGAGGDLWLNLVVTTAFASGGSATLQPGLCTAATTAPTDIVLQGESWAVADLAEGTVLWSVPLPRGLKAFTRCVYTVGTTAMSAGAIDAWIGRDPAYR